MKKMNSEFKCAFSWVLNDHVKSLMISDMLPENLKNQCISRGYKR